MSDFPSIDPQQSISAYNDLTCWYPSNAPATQASETPASFTPSSPSNTLQKLISGNAPLIIAHRGGAKNWPENTLFAFRRAAKAGVDAIELDVQVTKDGIPVLYHAPDLSAATKEKGTVSSKNWEEIQHLDVNWSKNLKGHFYSHPDLKISTLMEVLEEIPNLPLIVDLKSLPAEPLIRALKEHVPEHEWPRLILYSTQKEHTEWARKLIPQAVLFEDRDITRRRLVQFINSRECNSPSNASWLGFELKRKMNVTEKFTLGQATDPVNFQLWTKESMTCVRQMAKSAKVVIFGIDTREDFLITHQLGADAVYTDRPLELLQQLSQHKP
jgi:glycerophosphoryl diester phosphodiesterase